MIFNITSSHDAHQSIKGIITLSSDYNSFAVLASGKPIIFDGYLAVPVWFKLEKTAPALPDMIDLGDGISFPFDTLIKHRFAGILSLTRNGLMVLVGEHSDSPA